MVERVYPNGTVVCYAPESLTCTVIGWNGHDYLLERHDGGLSFWGGNVIAGACETPYVPPTPAKGNVHNLDYPANAKNGETITIKAAVVNVGGTNGDFSLRVIAAPQIPLITHYVGIVSAYKFTALVNLQVTMPSTGTVAMLGVQCIRHT